MAMNISLCHTPQIATVAVRSSETTTSCIWPNTPIIKKRRKLKFIIFNFTLLNYCKTFSVVSLGLMIKIKSKKIIQYYLYTDRNGCGWWTVVVVGLALSQQSIYLDCLYLLRVYHIHIIVRQKIR